MTFLKASLFVYIAVFASRDIFTGSVSIPEADGHVSRLIPVVALCGSPIKEFSGHLE